MQDFYSFYKRSLGKVSERAFNLFWSGQYENCFNLYNNVIASTGSIESLGFNDTLTYHHCANQVAQDVTSKLEIPEPPNATEVVNLYEYESCQEAKVLKGSNKDILTQPTILSKALIAASIGIGHGCKHAIETGTFLGASTYLFSGVFSTVDTIEADSLLYQSSVKFLTSRRSNIECHLGDSGALMSQIIGKKNEKNEKTMIFLDAHYSTGITSNEYGICPLLKELDLLMSSKLNCVIVIDDIRCMESPGYPSLKEILDKIPEGRCVTIQYDQLIIN